MKFYLLHYKVVFWVSLMLGFVYGMMDPSNQDAFKEVQSPKQWATMIAIWIFLFGIAGGLFHLKLHLIYGKKVRRLRVKIEDLETEE